jgi:GNAT superfamily N-acetyltransferase
MGAEPTIRTLDAADDLEALTRLLHRAYADLAARGLRYTATYQDVAITRRRIAGGEALVAEMDGVIVGTVTWYPPGSSDDGWYAQPGVAAFGQFGVEPHLRGTGIGRALIAEVERRARAAGAHELACDTAQPATDLIAMYERWGFRVVGTTDYRPTTNYLSVVLSKTL